MANPVEKRAEAMDGVDDLPALQGRWTICAMLFVATTINYVDRQVLSILKPSLNGQIAHLHPLIPGWPSFETTINVTDREYGYILLAFQIVLLGQDALPSHISATGAARRACGWGRLS